MPIRNSRWLPPQVIVLTQDHMGKYRNIFFSEAIGLIEPKLCINHWKVLYKLHVFYVDRNSKMTTTAGHSFYIGPIGSSYNQVNDTGSWEPLVLWNNINLKTWNALFRITIQHFDRLPISFYNRIMKGIFSVQLPGIYRFLWKVVLLTIS